MPEKIYTTYQIGKFCQVNIRTVIRWIETGKLKAYSTPGGHRRVKWSDLIFFLTQNQMPIPRELEEAKKKKILIIDNDLEFLVKATKFLLTIPDSEVMTASSGFNAGIVVAEWLPDMILLNFLIPDLDGFEAIKKIRENTRLKKILVVAVTYSQGTEETNRIKNSGIDSVIPKPIDREGFLKKINRLLYSAGIG